MVKTDTEMDKAEIEMDKTEIEMEKNTNRNGQNTNRNGQNRYRNGQNKYRNGQNSDRIKPNLTQNEFQVDLKLFISWKFFTQPDPVCSHGRNKNLLQSKRITNFALRSKSSSSGSY